MPVLVQQVTTMSDVDVTKISNAGDTRPRKIWWNL